jgi:hypothetical protein
MVGGKTIEERSESIAQRLAALEQKLERLEQTSSLPVVANDAPQQPDGESA